jgi:AraC-like DNA-binding protein
MTVQSTDAVPSRERFAYWREVISRRFVPLRPERVDRGPFWGEVEPLALGGLAATRLRCGPQRVHRGPREIAAASADVYFLNFQLAGESSFCQGSDAQPLHPGDWAVLDPAQPFELGVPGSLEQVCVALPREALAPWLSSRRIGGVRVDGTRGAGRLVADLLRALVVCGPLDAEAQALVASQLVELVSLAFRGDPTKGVDARAARYAAALRVIERTAARADLRPADVAAALRVSPRYLQVLFAERRDGVARRIWRVRLERARMALESPAERERSITEIALQVGFRDASHFSRAFAKRFGRSPREWRAVAAQRENPAEFRQRDGCKR